MKLLLLILVASELFAQQFQNPVTVLPGAGSASGSIRLRERRNQTGDNWVALTVPESVAANITFVMPGVDGTINQCIKTDGAGALAFFSCAGINLANTFTALQTFSAGITLGGNVAYTGSISLGGAANRSTNIFTDAFTMYGSGYVQSGATMNIQSGGTLSVNGGVLTLLPGAAPTVGNVWTATSTAGVGGWAAAASAGLPVVDTTAIVKGSVTDSKLLRFEVDGFTSATTRVVTPPDADITMAGINIAQTFSAVQTVSLNATTVAPLSGTVLHVVQNTGSGGRILIDTFASLPIFTTRRANGTAALPTALVADDIFMAHLGFGYGATGYSGAGIVNFRARAAGTWTDTSMPGYLTIETTAVGSVTAAERWRVTEDGHFRPGTHNAFDIGLTGTRVRTVFAGAGEFFKSSGTSASDYVSSRKYNVLNSTGGGAAEWRWTAVIGGGSSQMRWDDNAGDPWAVPVREEFSVAVNYSNIYSDWLPAKRDIGAGHSVTDATYPALGSTGRRWREVWGDNYRGALGSFDALSISGTITSNTNITVSTTGSSYFVATGSAFGDGGISLKSNSATKWWDVKSSGTTNDFIIRDVTSGVDRITITSAGNVQIPGAFYLSTSAFMNGTQWMDASRNLTNIGTATMAGAITANGGIATGSATNSTLYAGTGNWYMRTFSGADVGCAGVTNGWFGYRTDTNEIQMCNGGVMKKVALL